MNSAMWKPGLDTKTNKKKEPVKKLAKVKKILQFNKNYCATITPLV